MHSNNINSISDEAVSYLYPISFINSSLKFEFIIIFKQNMQRKFISITKYIE